jgi:mRNA interferase RelE/StbE
MLQVQLGSHAKRFLRKAHKEVRDRIMERIKKLAADPFPSDAKRVVGRREKVFRVRVGDHRILYVVFYDKNEILISDIDKRDRAY